VPALSRPELAFEVYLDLGPDRSLVRLRGALRGRLRQTPTLRTLESWSSRYSWQARLIEIERKAREASELEHVEWVREHRDRLRKEGLLLQQRGLEWLRQQEPGAVRAGDAIRAIESGFRLEALALGEVTERIGVEDHDERIERLTDDELARLINAAREG
jgi:hypothetical protein